jgi:hypothetical protein
MLGRGVKIYGGSQWMILSRAFCEYATNLRHIWRYSLFFRNIYVPDESFYHTLLMNSPFRDTLVNDNRRYIDWVSGPERPRVLRMSDLPLITASGAFFARKVNWDVDPELGRALQVLVGRQSS